MYCCSIENSWSISHSDFFKEYTFTKLLSRLVYLKLIYIKALSNIYFYYEKLFEKEIDIIYAGEESSVMY